MKDSAPTIKDVAAAAKTSVATASRALRGRGRVAIATRHRVAKAAAKLGYRVDPVVSEALSRARLGKPTGGHGAVGLLLPGDRVNPVPGSGVSECIAAIEERLASYGYTLDMLRPEMDYRGAPSRLVDVIRARGLRAVISMETVYPLIQGSLINVGLRAKEPDFPIVLIGHGDGVTGEGWKVAFDRYASGFCGAEKAFERGYRKPGLAIPVGFRFANEEIAAGYRRALERFLPEGHSLRPFVFDSADPAGLEKLDRWLVEEGIDCLLTYAIVKKARGFAAARGVPTLDLERSPVGTEGVPGVLPNWKKMGALAVETVMNSLRRRSPDGPGGGGRLLVAGSFQGELPLAAGFVDRRFVPLDLSEKINALVTEPGQWFGRFPLPLYGEECLRGAPGVFQLARGNGNAIGGIFLRSAVTESEFPGVSCPVRLDLPFFPESRGRTPSHLHVLFGCGYAERGAQPGKITIEGAQGECLAALPLVAGGRLVADDRANLQDWWPHYPVVAGAIPVYHPDDPQFFGSLYHLTVPVGAGPPPVLCRIESNRDMKTTLALLAASAEFVGD